VQCGTRLHALSLIVSRRKARSVAARSFTAPENSSWKPGRCQTLVVYEMPVAGLALLVEQLPASIAIFDADLRFLAASRRYLSECESLFSRRLPPPSEVVGRSVYEVMPDLPLRWREAQVRVLAGEELAEQEDFVSHEDGSTIYLRWSLKPWRTVNGQIGGELLFTELITEEVVAKRALAESEARFRATFENAAVGIAHVSSDLRWLRANAALCRILGWPMDEFLTKTLRDISHPDDLAVDLAYAEQIRAGKIDSFGMDKRHLRKDGTIVWARLTVSCVRRRDGSIDYFVAVIEDISARKRGEELLKRQADLLDQSHDAILELQTDDRGIVYWNRGAERLYGYTAAEAQGRRTHELLHTRAPIPIKDIDAQIVHGESWSGELTHTTRDGREIVVESRIVPVSYDGEMFALETNRDITDRKRAEEELAKSEERFRTSILRSPVPTALFDDREQILALSQSWLTAAGGVSAAGFQRAEDWTIHAYGERSGEVLELIRKTIATEPEALTQELILTVGGDKRFWNFVTSGLGALSDGRRLFVCVAQDVTDRKAYEERIELLMRESHHRIKNILGLVQVIARQTATGDAQDFIGRFSKRIQALAANQDLLVRHGWQRIDVKDLVQSQLGHFADLIGTRINFEGPKLFLNAAAAQAIGLALHELATNAGKYGALSTETGRVNVRWQFKDDTFVMDWSERGGPAVRPPERRGFGSTVIEAMAKRTVGGEVEADYAPSGFGWHLTCPAANALEATVNIHKS
jgi:PAS domain S-box-containing protein